jgi:hypothetical protein
MRTVVEASEDEIKMKDLASVDDAKLRHDCRMRFESQASVPRCVSIGPRFVERGSHSD